jgi:hypothetical protein
MPADPDTYATLLQDTCFHAWHGTPVVSLALRRLEGLDKAARHTVTLKLYECDYLADGTLDPVNTQELSTLTLAVAYSDAAAGWIVETRPKVADAPAPDFFLMLGTKDTPPSRKDVPGTDPACKDKEPVGVAIAVPPGRNYHDEDDSYDLGFVLEVKDAKPYDRRSLTVVQSHARVPAKHPVDTMLAFKEYANKDLPQHTQLGPVLGRFNDPECNPHREPDEAAAQLDDATIKALADTPDGPVDVDGLRLARLIDPKVRRDLIAAIRGKLVVDTLPANDLLQTDVQLAYFVVHDVGNGTTVTHYTKNAAGDPEYVTGFVNDDGSYASRFDFAAGFSGTLNTGRAPWSGYAIGFETVPIVLAAPSADRDKYPMIGTHAYERGYWHWTKELLATLVELYVLGCLRANHLLTVTTHNEADRNVMLSRILLTWTQAAIDAEYERQAKAWFGSAAQKDMIRGAEAAEAKAAELDTKIAEVDAKLQALDAAPSTAPPVESPPKRPPPDPKAKLTAERKTLVDQRDRQKGAAASQRAFRPKMMSIWTRPEDVHGDPYGFDPQFLYDLITARLTELSAAHPPPGGAVKLRPGVRYGVNPKRIVKPGPYPKSIINGSEHLHTFPQQSREKHIAFPAAGTFYKLARSKRPTPR